MTEDHTGRHQPPSPPKIPPKLRLNRSELLGLPFLFALPLLAILGFFGPATETARGQSGALEWSVDYPSRVRYEKHHRVVVRVENRGAIPLSELTIDFDPDYIHAFTNVAFAPDPDAPYLVKIPSLAPGESRLISVQLTADEYGSRSGWVSLSGDGVAARAQLSTFVFP